MIHLPEDLIVTIFRDAVLHRMAATIQKRELHEAWSYLAPVFDVWMRITYYEKHFPGSTESHGAVTCEP